MVVINQETTPPETLSPAAQNAPASAVSSLPNVVKVQKKFSLPGIGLCLASRADNSLIYSGLSDFSIVRVDVASEKMEPAVIGSNGHSSYVMGLVRCGNMLVSGSYDCSLIWWNSETGETIRRVGDAHARWIRMLAVNPDQTRIVSVGDDMKTKLWDTATGECLATWGDYELKTPHGFPSMLYATTFSPDGAAEP